MRRVLTFLFSLINFFQSRTNLKMLMEYAETVPGPLSLFSTHRKTNSQDRCECLHPGYSGFQHFSLITTPRGLLLKFVTFLFSLIKFFQSRTNLKILGACEGTDRGNLDFQHVALSSTPRGLFWLLQRIFGFFIPLNPLLLVQNKPAGTVRGHLGFLYFILCLVHYTTTARAETSYISILPNFLTLQKPKKPSGTGTNRS